MKRTKLFSTLAMLCLGATASAGGNSQAIYQADPGADAVVVQVWHEGEIGCGCETPCDCDMGGCDTGCEAPSCDMDMCCDGGCDSGCGDGCDLGCCSLLGDCDLGEPFALFGESCGYAAGGWIQMGYHDAGLPLFNSRPNDFQLHQAWLWAEKAIDTSCGFDIGGRIDYIYGTDSQDTQAFGIDNDHWDNDWDNGPDYGHAIPQLYMEAGYGDLSVKVGHFYTIIGWEVVTAPDNFFYSHAYTMYNSEPFTHTGALATLSVTDNLEVYGGYTLGWDSGFEDNGDSFLGGVSLQVCDEVSLTYATVGGIFAADGLDREQGYMHSIVADVSLTDKLQYIFQTDYLDTEAKGGTVSSFGLDSISFRETIGINQYLIYTISDCLALGSRFEWYDVDNLDTDASGPGGVVRTDGDVYALTLGVNVKPHANLVVRPEIRWDWDDNEIWGLDGDDQTTFGIDTIFLF